MKLTIDFVHGIVPEPGEVVATTRSTYLVLDARKVEGKHPHRWRLEVERLDEEPPVGTTVHPFRWYSRGRGKKQ